MEEFESPDLLYNLDASLNLPDSKDLVSDKIIPFDKVGTDLSIDGDYPNRTLNINKIRARLDALEKMDRRLIQHIYKINVKIKQIKGIVLNNRDNPVEKNLTD